MSNRLPHPNHDRGLEFDLSTIMSRRSLGMFLGTGGAAAAVAACTPGGTTPDASPLTSSAGPATAASAGAAAASSPSPALTRAIAECGVEIPRETAGPFPADGSNGPNLLEASGVVRRDIASSFGTGTARTEGVPLTFTLTLRANANGRERPGHLHGRAGGTWAAPRCSRTVCLGTTAASNSSPP